MSPPSPHALLTGLLAWTAECKLHDRFPLASALVDGLLRVLEQPFPVVNPTQLLELATAIEKCRPGWSLPVQLVWKAEWWFACMRQHVMCRKRLCLRVAARTPWMVVCMHAPTCDMSNMFFFVGDTHISEWVRLSDRGQPLLCKQNSLLPPASPGARGPFNGRCNSPGARLATVAVGSGVRRVAIRGCGILVWGMHRLSSVHTAPHTSKYWCRQIKTGYHKGWRAPAPYPFTGCDTVRDSGPPE